MQANGKPFTNQKPAASANEATCSLVRYGYAAKRQAVRTRLSKRAPAKNCAARFCGKRSCYGAMLQVVAKQLALSKMDSDEVRYGYACKAAKPSEQLKSKKYGGTNL